ncbi:class I SAM-dependent methyltransferase [Neobacillus sp. PS3-34]|uniref:class I SAM-dependent methyltransferase n=1 Tax=Neobacillus sp. PS3-34 TaxID=3070678 RepID=UPI0027E163FC|nr:class I SAM-dependent methyltransferase [Neobacillus sp. PS3-34]WML48564.1 class I SAM-dependent methyltransferase [Neobacillus sp. PS3-34]
MKDKVLEAYAKLAKDYELNVDTESGSNAYYERPAMMQLLPDNMEGLAVLDAGCAAGWYTEQFVQRGAKVTAIDISPEMVDAAKRRVGNGANIMVHDLSKSLQLQDHSFDLIISSLTLHYIDNWDMTFHELNRVLKPGGQFVFSVHHPFMDFTMFDRPDYFAHELLVDEWNKKESGLVEVTFFRMPLQEIMNVTAKYFILEKLVEPQAVPEFIEKLPESANWYNQLLKNPHFLIVKSRKGLE